MQVNDESHERDSESAVEMDHITERTSESQSLEEKGTTPKQSQDRTSNKAEDDKRKLVWSGSEPENPQNFSRRRKWLITIITAAMTFVVSFGSSIFSTVVEVTAQEFAVSEELMLAGVTLYVIGFAFGPLLWGPMSESLGRKIPYTIGYLGFIIFQIPVAKALNITTIMVSRFLSGAFGSTTLAVTAGIYVDCWDMTTRGRAAMLFAASVFAGPLVGPVVGEYTTKNEMLGWRWTAWFTMIMAGAFLVPYFFIVPETLAPILLRRRAVRSRPGTNIWAVQSPVTFHELVSKYLTKPFKMLVVEPILIVITIYMSLVYGILYLTFVAYPISFQYDRGIAFGASSLPFLAVFVGVVLGCLGMLWENTVIFLPKLKKAGKIIPEERLIPMIAGSFIIVIGLFWFAWTSFPSISPWPQIISGLFIGAGFVTIFMSGVTYLVDTYLLDAASANAANCFVRSAFAGCFPLFGTQMFKALGVQWASTVLAFGSLALVPAPILFYFYGKRIRSSSKFAYDLG